MGHLGYLEGGGQERLSRKRFLSSKLERIMGVSEEGNGRWGQGYFKQRKQPVQSPEARESKAVLGERKSEEGIGEMLNRK